MRRKLTIAGLGAVLLLAFVILLKRQAVRVGYYKWQLKAAGAAMFAKGVTRNLSAALPGLGNVQSRYSHARQALLDLGYLREVRLSFPAGSDWGALVRHAREQFPEGAWELGLDQPGAKVILTAPADRLDAWRKLVAESARP